MICSEYIYLSKHALNKRAIFSLNIFRSLRLHRAVRHIDHVQNRENFHLGDTIYTLGEAIESWENHVDELICGVTVLQTTSNAISVHCSNESFELIAVKDTISVQICGSECIINFSHEAL